MYESREFLEACFGEVLLYYYNLFFVLTFSFKLVIIIKNNLGRTIHNVKVICTISDENNNNTKQNYDYIDIIYDGKKSRFEISFYCGGGSSSPSALYFNEYYIHYEVRISDYD